MSDFIKYFVYTLGSVNGIFRFFLWEFGFLPAPVIRMNDTEPSAQELTLLFALSTE